MIVWVSLTVVTSYRTFNVWSDWSSPSVNSAEPLNGISWEFPHCTIRLSPPSGSSYNDFILIFGNFPSKFPFSIMDTCAPVSINTGIMTSFNLHCNMHLSPTNLATSSLTIIKQAVWYKPLLNTSMYSKQTNLKGLYSWNKMWSLKSLAMLKCESRTTLHAVEYKWQSGSVLMFCSYYFRNS